MNKYKTISRTTCALALLFLLSSCASNPAPQRTVHRQSRPITFEEAERQVHRQQQQRVLNSPPVDETKWSALKIGMTLKEVVALLGEPGTGEFKVVDVEGKQVFRAIATYTYDKGATVRTLTAEEFVEALGKDHLNTKLVDWTGRTKDAP